MNRVIRNIDNIRAEVECLCGLHITVEIDECGASAPVVQCQHPECPTVVCEHDVIECTCGLRVCPKHSAKYGGTMQCVVCIAYEMAEGAEELVEAL